MTSYKDLDVWKRSLDLSITIYRATLNFPKEEIYGITSQMRRASVSIPSNVAEGSKRSKKEFSYFVSVALGSLAELETQVVIASKLNYLPNEKVDSILEEIEVITKMLSKLLIALKN